MHDSILSTGSSGSDLDAERLTALIGGERRRIVLASMLSASAGATWIGQAFLLADAVGRLLGDGGDRVDLLSAALAFAWLVVLRIALDAASTSIGASASERVQLRAREHLLEAMAVTSPLDAGRPHSGEIAAIATHHVEALAAYLLRYQPAKTRVALVPIAILLATLAFSWTAALILIAVGPLIPIFMGLIGLSARAASERQLAEIGSMNAFLLDRLQGLTTIRLFDAAEATASGLRAVADRIHCSTMAVLRIAFLSSAVLELFAALGVALVAVYVGFNLLGYFTFGSYGTPLTLAGGLCVLLLAPEFFQPLRDFSAAYHDRAGALAACHEIGRILDAKSPRLLGTGDHGEAASQPQPIPSISLQNVSLHLNATANPILRNVSLAIEPGEHVALVGPSGSGKTMLLGMMAGLIAPSAGTIRIGGALLDHGNADRWRRRIAWLGQRPAFIGASVRSNLLLGRTPSRADALDEAIACMAARPVIDKLPRGLATLLGENGEGISGGEAQRLALVRAALADADVIFADEPTEHLDAGMAESIIAGLLEIAQGRTLVVATHDHRVVCRMHRVIDVSALTAPTGHRRLEAAE